MKTTSTAARRLLRESNPVPGDAFPGAAGEPDGQAVLAEIMTTPAEAATSKRRPARAWKVAVPAVAMTGALAGLLAVMLSVSGSPPPGVVSQPADSGLATLIANLTAHPSARGSDAAAVLRQLADAAARQPAVPLGPVVYTQAKSWGLDLNVPLHYDLGYVTHETRTDQSWTAWDGAHLDYSTYPGGKIPQGIIPLHQNGPSATAKAYLAWSDPAKLPVDTAALRRHLISGPPEPPVGPVMVCTTSNGQTVYEVAGGSSSVATSGNSGGKPAPKSPGGGKPPGAVHQVCHLQKPPAVDVTQAIVSRSLELMSSEPLPPAVRAALLRLLADAARSAHFVSLGTVADRAGHAGVAIGEQSAGGTVPGTESDLWVYVFDPATGALLGEEFASCKVGVGSYPAAGSCTPNSYSQILQVKAVQSIPAPPKFPQLPWSSPPQASATSVPATSVPDTSTP